MNDDTGLVLREHRIAAGVTQSDLARTMQISIWTLNRVEHGKRSFDDGWLDRLPSPIRERVAEHLRAGYLRQAWGIPRYPREAQA